jgi:hypothetical protein
VTSSEDVRIHALLLWIYNWFVNYTPGDTVMVNEECVYFVKETTMTVEPEWSVRVKCFSVGNRNIKP